MTESRQKVGDCGDNQLEWVRIDLIDNWRSYLRILYVQWIPWKNQIKDKRIKDHLIS